MTILTTMTIVTDSVETLDTGNKSLYIETVFNKEENTMTDLKTEMNSIEYQMNILNMVQEDARDKFESGDLAGAQEALLVSNDLLKRLDSRIKKMEREKAKEQEENKSEQSETETVSE